VKQTGALTVKITVTVFTNTKFTTVLFGGEQDMLNFGDGTPVQLVPETQNTIRNDLNPDGSIGVASFTTYHTYASAGSYLVSYQEPNRNEGVLNMDNSVNTTFYVETFITIAPEGPRYETPILLMDRPVLKGNIRFQYSESLACLDSNNYQLYYDITTPLRDRATLVSNYRLPGNLSIDHISGMVIWDTKFNDAYTVGEYSFAVKIYQLRDNKIVDYMHRDFQLVLTDDVAVEPTINGGAKANKRVFVPENSTTTLRMAAGSTLDAGVIRAQVESELEGFKDNFSYTTEDSTAAGVNYKVVKLTLTNNTKIIRDTPYLISLRGIFDNKITKDLTYIIATKDVLFDYHLPETDDPDDNPVAVEDEHLAGVIVVPNPVKDFLEIRNENNYNLNLRIHDLAGRTLQQQTVNTSTQIDMRSVMPGIYVCSVIKGSAVTYYKVVKE